MGFEVIGYADDVSILIRGKYESTLSCRMQTALNYTLRWCKQEGLNVNPSKTVIIPFTKKRTTTWKSLYLSGVKIDFSSEVKYLGVTLDKKLNWNTHLEQAIRKGTNALWTCSRAFGKKWDLNPKMIKWIYTAIVRPRISYASLIWWPKTKELTAQKRIGKLQRLACLAITGAMKSTSSDALNALLNLLPLHQFVQLQAEQSALKLNKSLNVLDGELRLQFGFEGTNNRRLDADHNKL